MSCQSTASAEEDVLEINGSFEGGPADVSLFKIKSMPGREPVNGTFRFLATRY